ncbi:MAG: glycosyltransferase involved in cell wall biosynthesis [Polaribacter sp.]|jgi:glycosyltransferase involved in cell wall biosynthesis
MIWLASFPRSGNTFFRNVLYEVYGIESSTFHQETNYSVDEGYSQYSVVKTHLLPNQIEPKDPSIKSVYLVRDGRDALVSIAHHRKDIVAPGSDFEINLLEAIIAPKGSHFGGWSENVRQWSERADIIIRFEDLIRNPIKEVEKLRSIMDLPHPQLDKLPTFKDLKFGAPKYGSAKKHLSNKSNQKKRASIFFRKGKIGGWEEEMSSELQQLFWDIHADTMRAMQYDPQGAAHEPINTKPQATPYKILIEANKLFMPGNDGVKRYQMELLDGLTTLQDIFPEKWDIDLYLEGGTFLKLNERGEQLKGVSELLDEEKQRIDKVFHQEKPYENRLLQFKDNIQKALPGFIYHPLSSVYRSLPLREILRWYRGGLAKKEIDQHRNKFENYDLIHIPLPQNFFFLKEAKGRFLVTVHDLTHKSYPEFHTKENVKLSEKGMQEIIKKKAHLLAISESTKADILKDYPSINEDNISVIYEACNRSHFKPQCEEAGIKKVREKHQLPDCPYFLTLSTLEPRKNLLNTIRAFENLVTETGDQNLALFICGKKGWKTEELFRKENLNNKNIFFTGFVDEVDLPALYSNALALCYVSLYEGFGLPPMEAMACGTTVIYGNNSSMPEVIGDAGIAADPNDVNDIKENMMLLLEEETRLELYKKAIKRSNKFSWTKTAWETLNLYERCIKERR